MIAKCSLPGCNREALVRSPWSGRTLCAVCAWVTFNFTTEVGRKMYRWDVENWGVAA